LSLWGEFKRRSFVENKNMQTFSRLLVVVATTAICSAGFAQHGKPRVSPAETASGMIAQAHMTIDYSSPSVKGRIIWGNLVPYDSVWRAGANEATSGVLSSMTRQRINCGSM
jgi:hypothetical protein